MKKIVFIRNDSIGDFVLWLDSIKYLRENLPNYHTTLVCNQNYSDLARQLGIFHEVIEINAAKLMKLDFLLFVKTILMLRKHTYDMLVCPQYTRNIIVDSLVLAINAKMKIGIDAFYGKFAFLKRMFDSSYDKLYFNHSLQKMELELNIDFINYLFGKHYSSSLPNFYDFKVFNEPQQKTLSKGSIVISLGSSNVKKNWPLSNFLQLIKNLAVNEKVMLIGGQHEIEMANYILSNLGSHNISSIVGKTNLFMAIEQIKAAKLFIGNDSALVHFAVALQVPSICFLGGGHFGRFMPYQLSSANFGDNIDLLPTVLYNKMDCYGCSWRCSKPLVNGETWQCIESIGLAKATNVIQQKLQKITE